MFIFNLNSIFNLKSKLSHSVDITLILICCISFIEFASLNLIDNTRQQTLKTIAQIVIIISLN